MNRLAIVWAAVALASLLSLVSPPSAALGICAAHLQLDSNDAEVIVSGIISELDFSIGFLVLEDPEEQDLPFDGCNEIEVWLLDDIPSDCQRGGSAQASGVVEMDELGPFLEADRVSC
jgi:hypothetical protein